MLKSAEEIDTFLVSFSAAPITCYYFQKKVEHMIDFEKSKNTNIMLNVSKPAQIPFLMRVL